MLEEERLVGKEPSPNADRSPLPPVVTERVSSIDNLRHPYLEKAKGLYSAGRGAIFSFGAVAQEYGFCLLTPEGVQKIVSCTKNSGVISLGAGKGYSEYLLEQMGIDVVSFDIKVPEQTFSHVQQGGIEVVAQHTDRTLLLAYPDGGQDQLFAVEALKNFHEAGGRRFIFVGETETCLLRSHDPELYALMKDRSSDANWKEVGYFRLPAGPGEGRRPHIRVFDRKDS